MKAEKLSRLKTREYIKTIYQQLLFEDKYHHVRYDELGFVYCAEWVVNMIRRWP